ncbi:MAG: asparagine synthase (glutamine-hydrolyzing) [Arenimonas sp.]
MCGITGVFAYSPSAPTIDRNELRRVRDHMQTRGPDGLGEWFSDDGRLGLGHRRLSIIDLSENASQPMRSDDGRYVVIFNGEIYNYRELRKILGEKKYVFRTQSDTEVLLHLYAEKGAAMLQDLRGMFAIAIWDNVARTLFLARDVFGIKPLYYADDGKTFRFASQVKALLQADLDRAPEAAGHAGFFLWGSVPEPYTLYKSIRALPPGHSMLISDKGAAPAIPFCSVGNVLAEAAHTSIRGDRQTALREIANAIHESVIAHQVADVPVGVFLSSGLDSCLIASAAMLGGTNINTMTLGFLEYAGTHDDEVPIAEGIAKTFNTHHHNMITSRQDFENEREQILRAMDQPSIDGVNTWFVARVAAQLKLKSALSGIGGDELFASYPSFRQVPMLVNKLGWLGKANGLSASARKLAAPFFSRFGSPKWAGLLEYSRDLGSAYLLRRSLFAPWELASVMDSEMAVSGWKQLQDESSLQQCTKAIDNDRLAVSALEMNFYMRNQLLRDADWAGMAQSLEIRLPLLDIKLLRSVAPWLARFPDISKAEIAGVAAPRLPKHVLKRPKTGFSIPIKEWVKPHDRNRHERGLRGWAKSVYLQQTEAKK